MKVSDSVSLVPNVRATPSFDGHAGVAELVVIIRRVIAARVRDKDVVDDLAQETITRVIAARSRVPAAAVVPYAITVACNLVIKHHQSMDRLRRNVEVLADHLAARDLTPDAELLRHERLQAVAVALGQLTPSDRKLLLAHEVGRVGTAELAEAAGVSAGAVAAQLHRSRARLRVEFLLADAGIAPPTTRCRPVLQAISAGDRRRQRELDVGGHVLDCTCCMKVGAFLARSRSSEPSISSSRRIRVSTDSDLVVARHGARQLGATVGFTANEITEITTAISEVARNIIDFAAPGYMSMIVYTQSGRNGIVIVARDKGPGIPDVNRALRDGVGTDDRLGIGLGGARRLMSQFDIRSAVGKGTTITMAKWATTATTGSSPRR